MAITHVNLYQTRTDLHIGGSSIGTIHVTSIANYVLLIKCWVIGVAVSGGASSGYTDYSEAVITQSSIGNATFASANSTTNITPASQNPQQGNSTAQSLSTSHAEACDSVFIGGGGSSLSSTVRWTVAAGDAICTVTNEGAGTNDFTVLMEITEVSNQ